MRRAIRLLNLRRLVRVRLRMVIAVVAVAAGSSLALSVVIVNGSTSYSLNRLTQQVSGGAGLRVVGATANGGITFATLAATVRTPGVRTVIPVVEAISAVRTNHDKNQDVLVIGVNCGAVTPTGGLGCAAASSAAQGGRPTASISLRVLGRNSPAAHGWRPTSAFNHSATPPHCARSIR